MEDKKFDEIMQKYVSDKTRGMEADFSKLNENDAPKVKNKYKFIWATVSCIFIIAIALSVVLPLTLLSNGSGGNEQLAPTINYFEHENTILSTIETKDELSTKYNITAELPTIQDQETIYCIMLNKENNNVIGVFIETSIYNEYFDFYQLYIMPENNVLNTLLDYETLEYKTTWCNCVIRYYVEYGEDDGFNTAQIYFISEGYKYCLNIYYYGDLTVEAILDLIFTKD